MASNNFKILFWLFKAKTNKKGETPLYLRISYGMARKNISTGFFIQQNKWDGSKGMVRGSKPEAQQINNYISQTKAKLMELFNAMLKERRSNPPIPPSSFNSAHPSTTLTLRLRSGRGGTTKQSPDHSSTHNPKSKGPY